MEKNEITKKYYLYVVLFIILNALATYIITTQSLNRYIITFDYTFIGVINSFVGNVSFLLFIVLIINLPTKKVRTRTTSLIVTSFILNGILFAINIFNRFYGTSFTFNAFQIFQNPAGNFGLTIFFEALREIIIYYRIIIFIPFIVMLTLGIIYNKKIFTSDIKMELNIVRLVNHILSFIVLLFINITLFASTTINVEVVESAKATYATQNIGLYNFLVLDAIGFNYDVKEFNASDVLTELENNNKNKTSYVNEIDQKYYTKDVLINNINIEGEITNNYDKLTTKGLLEDYNLVLVHLETFNYFLLEYSETSKHLYNLKAILDESYVFNNFYTTVGLGNSFDAELAVLTGLYANGTSTLAWDYNGLPDDDKYDFQTIPNLFNEKGYQTNSFHGNSGKFYNREIIHPELFKFNKFYSQEVMLEEVNLTNEEVAEIYEHEVGVWSSDRFTLEFMNNKMNEEKDIKYMNYLLTMLPHTPFYYDPFYPDPYDTDMYDEELIRKFDILTLKYFNYLKYYNEMMQMFIEDVNGYGDDYEFNVNSLYEHQKTAYIFYGDHGSSIQFDDVNYIYNNELTNLEIRQKLLQTIAFIYVPGNNLVTKEIDGKELTLYEGMLKGEQNLVRDQIDLYRTIIDLFNLPISSNDFLFGVNGLSNEPTYALDNKSLNIITDNFVGNIRNGEIYRLNNQIELEEINKFKHRVIKFKKSSDIAINNNLYKTFYEE